MKICIGNTLGSPMDLLYLNYCLKFLIELPLIYAEICNVNMCEPDPHKLTVHYVDVTVTHVCPTSMTQIFA